MANIFSYDSADWTYVGTSRLSSNSFRFNSVGSYAFTKIRSENMGELGGELFFRGFISPNQYRLTQGLRCRLDIYTKQDPEQVNWEIEKHFVYIKGDRNGAVNQKIVTHGGAFDYIDLRLEALPDSQMSLGGAIDLTSFVIDNASSSSTDNIEEEIEAALPFLIYDNNVKELTNSGSDSEIYVGMIPVQMYRSNVDTDAGFRTNIAVDADGVLTERFYRNGIEELLSPVVMDIKAGRHLIADDHAYLNVPKGPHTFLATLQFEGGTMEIDTRKTLYTIETSRAGERDSAIEGKVLDMALSGVERKLMPDEVWLMVKALDTELVHIQHGTYNPDNPAISFQNDIEYPEEVVCGAIEFNGYWQKAAIDVGRKKFISTGKPKVLLQRADGSLKYGDYDKPDLPELTIEAGGVADCSLIRGWDFRETVAVDNNMGMIAAYVKDDGKAYYRTIINGAMDPQPFLLTFLDAAYPLKRINTFRTNDYRVGFTATDNNDGLFTILTDRCWQGDSVESAYLESSFGQDGLGYNIIDKDPGLFSPVEADNPVDGQHINIYWNEPLERKYDNEGNPVTITGITITDSSPVPINVIADSVIVSETNRAMTEFISTAQRGINTQVYLTHYGLMTEKFANYGIDGFTAPVFIKVAASNGKTYTKSLGSDDIHNYSLPDSTTEVNNLVSRGTPDNPVPSPSEQDKSAESTLTATFGSSNVSFAPTLKEIVTRPLDDESYLKSSFGINSVTYLPELTELLSRTTRDETRYLTAAFSSANVSYDIQAYTINNIPI